MENEKKFTETNENSLNKKDFSKEFSYLNQIKGLINFNLFKQSTLCENNFYETIAWYIDNSQKEDFVNWENSIQKLINSLKNFKGSEPEKLKYLYRFFGEKKITRFEANGWQKKASNLKELLSEDDMMDFSFTLNSEGKVRAIFPGMIREAIPERYYTWTTASGFENKVISENRSALARSIKEQREKADELVKKL